MYKEDNKFNLKKVLFIDRDWTLIQEPLITFQVDCLEDLVFLPKVISSLAKIIEAWYELVIVTNQDWLWTKSNPRKNYELINKKIFEVFKWEWVEFIEYFECSHFIEDKCECRKPKIWILSKKFLNNYDWSTEGFNPFKIDLDNSYMIWDRDTDKEFAENIWVKFERVVYWNGEYNWENVVKRILKK